MNENELAGLIDGELVRLLNAVEALTAEVHPSVPAPRPRVFEFCPGVRWPHMDMDRIYWTAVTIDSGYRDISYSSASRQNTARSIIKRCGCQPRKVLRTLRRIQAATAWCLARAEGRKRMAQEILRQQSRAIEALEAEIVMRKLAQ